VTAATSDLGQLNITLVRSLEEANDCLRWLSTCDEVAIDTETTGLDKDCDVARIVQLGDEHTAYVIPLEAPGWGVFAVDVLRRFEGSWVLHNMTYDYQMIKNTLGVELRRDRCHDTRLMAHVLESTGSLALKNLSKKHVYAHADAGQERLHEELKKPGVDWDTVPIEFEPYWLYAGFDTILTKRLKNVLYPRVLAEAPRSYDLELAVSWVTNKMERKGARVDRDYVRAFLDKTRRYVDQADDWGRQHYGIRLSSNDELAQRLLREDVALTKFTAGGRYSVDKEVLAGLDHPLAITALRRRQAVKLASTYLETYLTKSERDGRIHPSINTVGGYGKNPFEPGGSGGVRTGRMSMSDPNLQNVPVRTKEGKAIRNGFVPDEGNLWIKCDADQIEMRGMAHMSGDAGLIDAFVQAELDGGDFFVNVARVLYDDPNFQKNDPRRSIVKNSQYAKIFGAGIEKFAKTANVAEQVAADFMKLLDRNYPDVPRWIKSVERDAKTRLRDEGEAYVRSPLTNRKHVADDGKLYTLVNYLIQGTAGELLKLKMVEADAVGLGDYMTLCVHDEVDLDVPRDEVPAVTELLVNTMTDRSLFRVPITWSADVGDRWGNCG
jgi:DNA polymerase I